jgi:hypothetical protein
MRKRLLIVVLVLACGLACSQQGEYSLSLCLAVDVSGTYTDQLDEVINITRTGILPFLLPGDSLVVVRIDSQSYEQENVVARLALDQRPSNANAQKLAFATQLEELASIEEGSTNTDIRGAIMLCADHLRETPAGTKAILVFSDLEEDQPNGSVVQLSEDELQGIYMAAMNVKQLRGDSTNPEVYRKRLAEWQQKVLDSGAEQWRIIVDPAKLPVYLESIRK